MNERTVLDFLNLHNPWWHNRLDFPFQKVYPFKRSDYYYLLDEFGNSTEYFVILGPRGVGKSTVIMELIRNLLGFSDVASGENKELAPARSTVDCKRILHISFESANLQKLTLIELLQIFTKYVLREDLSKLSSPIYVFFDEIQDIEWGQQIKEIHNLQYPIKIMVSGSSSTAMVNEASKAARRVRVYSMHPLKFSDYLRYNIPTEEFFKIIKSIKELRLEIIENFEKGATHKIYDLFLQIYHELKPWDTQIQLHFEEYLIKGGYPGLFKLKDYLRASEELNQSFSLGFHKDLAVARGIGDPKGIKHLSEFIASISSCETNYTSLMENSGVGSNTDILKKYLYHLEMAYLIKLSHQFKGNSSKRTSSFKIYLTDVAVRNMLVGLMNELLLKDPQQCGYAIETLVFDHLIRLNFKFNGGRDIYYWRDKKNDKEVDVILDFKSFRIPVEIKKSDNPQIGDVAASVSFCKGNKPCIVSCGKKLDLDGNVIFVPHWLLTMIC